MRAPRALPGGRLDAQNGTFILGRVLSGRAIPLSSYQTMCSCIYHMNHWSAWRGEVRTWGFSMAAPTLDRRLYLALHRLGMMGTEEKQLLARLISPGMQILDVGANIGLYALWMAKCAGDAGRVFTFEPVPQLFDCLVESCRRSGGPKVECLNLALGAADGSAVIYERAFNSGDGRMGASNRAAHEVRVEVRRLDNVLPGQRFDFIKIDAQGFELNVLRGMERALDVSRDAPIWFEYWPRGLAAAGTEPASLVAFLNHRGYRIYSPAPGDTFVAVRPDADEMVRHSRRRPWGHSGNFLAARRPP